MTTPHKHGAELEWEQQRRMEDELRGCMTIVSGWDHRGDVNLHLSRAIEGLNKLHSKRKRAA